MSVFENGNCASCNEPVQGYSSINGKVYCHSDERHCYQIALWKLRERNRKEMSKELIERAIERLKELKSEGFVVVDNKVVAAGDGYDGVGLVSDHPVFVTMTRTIDAQIAILENGLDIIEALGEQEFDESLSGNEIEALAKAILGVE